MKDETFISSTSEDVFTWSKSFKQSLSNNSQLVFSKKVTLSTINLGDNLPTSETFDIQEFHHLQGGDEAIVCLVDNRTAFYNCLKGNSIAHLTNYFPLSREKYKMNCLVLSSDVIGVKQQMQLEAYLKINYKYNHPGISFDEYKSLSESRINIWMSQEMEKEQERILNCYWSKLSSEDKLDYESRDKDSIKGNEKSRDEDKFEAQEEMVYSKNFTVLLLIPLDVEHSIFPMPQVVANSRRPNFESLMKPHKKPKKYFFNFDFSKSNWNFKELYI